MAGATVARGACSRARALGAALRAPSRLVGLLSARNHRGGRAVTHELEHTSRAAECESSHPFALDGGCSSDRGPLTPHAPHAGSRGAPDRGPGAVAPARLDTQREIAPEDIDAAGSETPKRVSRQVARARARAAFSHRFGRPVSRPWRAWVEDVARLTRERYRRPDVASALLHCGEFATVYDCDHCGRVGRVEVRASCHSRVCPWCSRIAAQKSVQNVFAAVRRVPGYVAEDARKVLAAAILEKHRAAALRDRWKGLAAAALERGDARVAEGHEARA